MFGTPSIADSVGEIPVLVSLGDADIVVALVVAVRGLSPVAVAEDIAAAEDEGNFPVNSSFFIRDFKSSSSSQTVEGAVVDMVDSVVLRPRYFGRSVASELGINLLVDRAGASRPSLLRGLRDAPDVILAVLLK